MEVSHAGSGYVISSSFGNTHEQWLAEEGRRGSSLLSEVMTKAGVQDTSQLIVHKMDEDATRNKAGCYVRQSKKSMKYKWLKMNILMAHVAH